MLWMKRLDTPWQRYSLVQQDNAPSPPSVQEYCEKHDKDLRVVPPDFLDLNSLSIAGIFWRLHLTDSRTQTQY